MQRKENMERLDQALVRLKLVSGRDRANEEIKKGLVLVNEKVILKPSFKVEIDDEIKFIGELNIISRAQRKLNKAMEVFNLDINGYYCLDVGASTGGFTKVLLDHGARHVIALDVGHNQLHDSLKVDSRVTNLEGYNFKNAKADDFKVDLDLISMDVSFISILKLIPSLKLISNSKTKFLILIKPQFEAGKSALNSQGIVRNKKDHLRVLKEVSESFSLNNFNIKDIIISPIKGSDGNIEYLMYIDGIKIIKNGDNKINKVLEDKENIDLNSLIEKIVGLAFD